MKQSFIFSWVLFIIFLAIFSVSCQDRTKQSNFSTTVSSTKPLGNEQVKILIAAEMPGKYLPLLKNLRVGLIVNPTSMVADKHLVDFLLEKNVNVIKIFAPEHGFRGKADAGEHIKNAKDLETGLPIISLFGNNQKPKSEQLKDIDCIVFDIQDIGVRFYTYISTMHLAMEACAENDKMFVVLDRPNPNGMYVDGPVLEKKFTSFVGMHPIPIVHGLTVGELAQMINGEGWLSGKQTCKLKVVPMENYEHSTVYHLPVKPSPNLPNDLSIKLYSSLCLFEATMMSIGRGTQFPFQVIGYPKPAFGNFSFTPKSIIGMSKRPKHKNKLCYGVDFRGSKIDTIQFSLQYLIKYYELSGKDPEFFNRTRFFNLLAGNDVLAKQIKSGISENEIRATWQDKLLKYKQIRSKYLIYK